MSMYGAHVTTVNIRGQRRLESWMTYGSWASCFAGLANGNCSHLEDDGTAIASIALASQPRDRNGVSKSQEIQRAFLFGELCQRLTDGAFLSWEIPDLNTKVGTTQGTWGDTRGHVSNVRPSAHIVNFIPHRRQDLLVTAFRLSNQAYRHGIPAWVTPDDYEYLPLALALVASDGKAYCDSNVIFGTPSAGAVLEFVEEKYEGDFDELYDDDIGGHFHGEECTHLTEVGLADMLKRSTEDFEGFCRQGLGGLLGGYIKDVELGKADLLAMRPDDPIGLAAPMRFTQVGGRRLHNIGVQGLIGLIKEILRG